MEFGQLKRRAFITLLSGAAARGAGAASGTVGSRFLNSAAEQGFAGRVAAYRRGLGLAVA